MKRAPPVMPGGTLGLLGGGQLWLMITNEAHKLGIRLIEPAPQLDGHVGLPADELIRG